MDPEQLAAQIAQGDDSAGPLLVSVAGPMLAGYADQVASDLRPADRDQIVQKALETVVRRIDRYDPGRGTLLAWARPFVRHAALMWRRDHPGGAPVSLEQAPEQQEPTSDLPDPRTERRVAAINVLLAGLSSTDQTIIRLHTEEQLTFGQIADALIDDPAPTPERKKRFEGACRKRYGRAIGHLRELAADVPDLEDLVRTPAV